ncbi:glycosyltransferase family 4 protein, partial [Tessaracoccus lubricantis]|uniref:glycosyltransferase family 4 protein n=1 Tax=Tessaracoccus lubricantis TaxID=545543 RepID=UPI0036324974
GDAVVARPGVEPAGVADGSSGAPTLLWLSRLTDGKDPLTFVQALSRLTDLAWTARLVGPDDVDPDLSARVRQFVVDSGLSGRVTVEGARTGADLEEAWRAANLLVHTSRAEMYGMVVAEAAARGIPAIVTEATGATEARTAGADFVPGDVEGLSEALRAWLSDGELRASWRAEALERRGTVPGWDQTVASVAAALQG